MKGVDCCSLNGLMTTDGLNPIEFKHSIKYNNWFEKNGILYRNPNHLNCIKSSIAKQFKFNHKNLGEDMDWSYQILQSNILKTEHEIQETIYFYDYISNK